MERRVVELTQRRASRRRPAPARKSPDRAYGRAWINGREVGGVDPRFAHLAAAYD